MGKRVLRGTDTARHQPLGGATRTTTDWEGLDALAQGPVPLLPWPLFGRTPARVQPGGGASESSRVEGGEEVFKLSATRPVNIVNFIFNVTILYDNCKP